MAEMSVIIDRQDGLGFHGIPGEEAVVQAVLFCAYNLQAQGEILLSNNISALALTFSHAALVGKVVHLLPD